MATHDFVRFSTAQHGTPQSEDQLGKTEGGMLAYRQPKLTLVGAVTRVVQGQPVGNRYDVYERWQD